MALTQQQAIEEAFSNVFNEISEGNANRIDYDRLLTPASNSMEPHPINGIIIGVTKCGKTELLNTIFSERLESTQEIAMTPVARRSTNGLLTIYDTVGFRHSDFNILFAMVKKTIQDSNISTNPDDHIHFVWYCFEEAHKKFED